MQRAKEATWGKPHEREATWEGGHGREVVGREHMEKELGSRVGVGMKLTARQPPCWGPQRTTAGMCPVSFELITVGP